MRTIINRAERSTVPVLAQGFAGELRVLQRRKSCLMFQLGCSRLSGPLAVSLLSNAISQLLDFLAERLKASLLAPGNGALLAFFGETTRFSILGGLPLRQAISDAPDVLWVQAKSLSLGPCSLPCGLQAVGEHPLLGSFGLLTVCEHPLLGSFGLPDVLLVLIERHRVAEVREEAVQDRHNIPSSVERALRVGKYSPQDLAPVAIEPE